MDAGERDVFAAALGAIVQQARTRRGLSQHGLAAALGASQATVSRIENGLAIPEAFLYGQLAGALGTTIDDLDTRVRSVLETTKRAARAACCADVDLATFAPEARAGLITFVVALQPERARLVGSTT